MPPRQAVLNGRISSLKQTVSDISSSIQTGDLKTAKPERKSGVKGVLAELRLLGGALHSLQELIHDLEGDDDDSAIPSARRQKFEWPILDGCDILMTALESIVPLTQPQGLREAKATLAAYRTKFSFVIGSCESLEDISLQFSLIEKEPLPLLNIHKDMDQLFQKAETAMHGAHEEEDKPSAETVSAWLTIIQSATEDREPEEFLMEKSLVQSRKATTPQYQRTVQWPKYAEDYYEILRPQICSLFRIGPPRSFNLVQWVLEYARETYPNIFGPSALSPTRLLDLTDALCDESVSPLHIAAALGLPSLCRDLLSMGADIDQPSSLGTPLFCALAGPAVFKNGAHPESWIFLLGTHAVPGQGATVSLLLDKKANCGDGFTWKDANEASLAGLGFWVALITGHYLIFSRILTEGAHVDKAFLQLIDRHAVLQYGQLHKKIFARLLTDVYDAALRVENQAHLEFNDNENHDALSETMDRLRERVRDLLTGCQIEFVCAEDGGRIRTISIDEVFKNLVQHAILGPDALLLKRLSMDPRFDPNMLSSKKSQSTLLHVAAGGSHLEVMDMLIKAGADLESADTDGRTPVMVIESTEALKKLVLEYGAKTTSTDIHGRTIWHYAAATNDEVLLKWLCENDPCKLENMYKVDELNWTPLDQAIQIVHSLANDPKNPKPFSPRVARIMVKQYDRLPPQSSSYIFETVVEWGELELLEALLEMKSDSPLELSEALVHHINLGASEPLVDRVLELSQNLPVNDENGNTAAETILLNTELRFLEDDLIAASNHPSCHHELSSQVYCKLLTPEVMNYRNSAGQGIWERFCKLVIRLLEGSEDGRAVPGLAFLTKSIILAIRHLADRGAMADYERETGKSAFVCAGKAGETDSTYSRWKQPLLPPILEASRNDATESFLKSHDAYMLLNDISIGSTCPDLARMLIQRGACIDDERGWTGGSGILKALYADKSLRHVLLEKIFDRVHPNAFLARLAGTTKEAIASSPEFFSAIKALIDDGMDLDWVPEPLVKSERTFTLLAVAAFINDCKLIELLLRNGADRCYVGQQGMSPLMAAAESGSVNAAALLLEHMESPDLEQIFTDDNGMTWNVLQRAASRGTYQVLECLLERRELFEKINDTTKSNPNPPIHLAIDFGSARCVTVLRENRADLYILNADGMSPMQSAKRKDETIARYLKDVGVVDTPFKAPEDTVTLPRSRCRRVGRLLCRSMARFAAERGETPLNELLEDLARREICDAIPQCANCSLLSWGTVHSKPHYLHLLLSHTPVPLTAGCKSHWPYGFSAISSAFKFFEGDQGNMMGLPRYTYGLTEYLGTCLDVYLEQKLPWLNLSPSPIHAIFLHKRRSEATDHIIRIDCYDQIIEHLEQNAEKYYWKFVVPLGLLSSPESVAKAAQMDIKERVLYCAVNGRLTNKYQDCLCHGSKGATPLHLLVRNIGFSGPFVPITCDRDMLPTAVDMLEALLQAGAEVDAQDDDYSTPLHLAVRFSQEAIIEALLRADANPNIRDRFGYTPLVHAMSCGRNQVVELLIRHGADTSVLQEDHNFLLMVAKVDPEIFNRLSGYGVDLYQRGEKTWALISQLFSFQGVPKSYVLNGCWDFHRLACPGVISTLVLNGHSAHTLKMVLKRFPKECRDGLINSKTPYPDHGGCEVILMGNGTHLQTLLDFGFDLETECSPAGTPLMFACRMGRLEAVKLLVRQGARISYTTNEVTRSAVHIAKPFPTIQLWLLVDRHLEQQLIGWTETGTFEAIKPWSGPRVAEYRLCGQDGEFGRLESETNLEFGKRLKGIRAKLMGKTLLVKLLLDREPLGRPW